MASIPLKESDYVGKIYGNLTVLKFDGYRGNSTSLCVSVECKCGNTKSVQLGSLKRGTTRSCGCLNRVKVDDYIGKTYNRLTVFGHHRNETGDLFLDCDCKCGNTASIRFYDVLRSATKSCGCLIAETNSINNKARKQYNEFEYIDEDTVKVWLSNCNEFMICDSSTWDVLRYYLWRKHHEGYATADLDDGRIVAYHVVILECPTGYVRDHINRNRLDNRYSNLRVVTPTANAINRTLLDKNKSGHPGVYFDKSRNRWRSFYADPITKQTKFSDFTTYEDALKDRIEKEQTYYKIESLTTNKIINIPIVSRIIAERVNINKSR